MRVAIVSIVVLVCVGQRAIAGGAGSMARQRLPASSIDQQITRVFRGKVEKNCWLKPIPDLDYSNPCELVADFDGDRRQDYSVLVIETSSKRRRGIAFLFGNGRSALAGAGRHLGNGGDDFSWMDAWKVVAKSELRKDIKLAIGDGLLVEETGSAGGLIAWLGRRLRWQQWSD